MDRFSTVCTATVSLCITGATLAQQIPPLESGPKVVEGSVVDGEIKLVDAENGAPILMPKGYGVFEKSDKPNALTPDMEVQFQPSGYDIIYTFANPLPQPAPMGELRLGILTLGTEIQARDFQETSELVDKSSSDGVKVLIYPFHIYSPVAVLQNDDYVVGVSLQYPVLEYRHEARLAVRSPGGKYAKGLGGQGWGVEFRLSTIGDKPPEETKLYHPGFVPPGEERTYVVSVRVEKNTDEWIRTLVPYRNYFLSMYGGVDYERDPRPIVGWPLSSAGKTTSYNPKGWNKTNDYHPEKEGYELWAEHFKSMKGWPRTMVWAPTGLYKNNQQNNFPPQFTSPWLESPEMMTALDPNVGLASIPASGKELGLWWGRSAQIADKWDDPVLEDFDPENPVHFERALLEIDLAASAGATLIGLDAFVHGRMPTWKQYDWIHFLKDRHPQIQFVAEPMTTDIIHNSIATQLRAHEKQKSKAQTPEDVYRLKHPHYLADFLNPGHETLAKFRYGELQQWFGVDVTQEMVEQDVASLAAMGYVPIFSPVDEPLYQEHAAAESWFFSIPEDLQIDPDDLPDDPTGEGTGDDGESEGDDSGDNPNDDPDDGQSDSGDSGDGDADPNGGGDDDPKGGDDDPNGGNGDDDDSSVTTFGDDDDHGDNPTTRGDDDDSDDKDHGRLTRDPVESHLRAARPVTRGPAVAPAALRGPTTTARAIVVRGVLPGATQSRADIRGDDRQTRTEPSQGVVLVQGGPSADRGSARPATRGARFRRLSFATLRDLALRAQEQSRKESADQREDSDASSGS